MGFIFNSRSGILETLINGSKNEFKMVKTNTSHCGIFWETRNREDKEIMYLKDKEEDLTSY